MSDEDEYSNKKKSGSPGGNESRYNSGKGRGAFGL